MKLGHTYYVYILECADKSYYTGVTNDLDNRINEHNAGDNQKSYTFYRRPLILKFFQIFSDVLQAIEFEKQIKGWSRKKKEALIDENFNELVRLANKK